MKKITYLLIAVLSLFSCKKTLDPTLDPTETTVYITLTDKTTKQPILNGDVYLMDYYGQYNPDVFWYKYIAFEKTNSYGQCVFNFTPDEEYNDFFFLSVADGYYENHDLIKDNVCIGEVNNIRLEIQPEAFLKVFVKNTTPYDQADIIFIEDYGIPSGGSGTFYGVTVDAYTFARTWGNHVQELNYTITKNNVVTKYTCDIYCPANDTTYY